MVKFAHLLVLSALIVWLAGSGCLGNDTSKIEKSESNLNAVDAGNGAPVEDMNMELTQADVPELDSDMAELETMLENTSSDEEALMNRS